MVCTSVSFGCFNMCTVFFFFKQKTAYEMRISDWSSDVCSSDLVARRDRPHGLARDHLREAEDGVQGRAQLVAHQREEARLGAALRLGEAARFGVRLRAPGAGDGAAPRLLPAVLEVHGSAASRDRWGP